jgi:hypothetical protein
MGTWTGVFPWYWCFLISPRHLILLIMIFCGTNLNVSLICRRPLVSLGSFLTRRSQCVSAGGVLSGFLPALRGVPQGSVLGPLLFTLSINDICRVVWLSHYHVYDFQFYDTSNISLCLKRVNSDLDGIYRWSVDNGILLNGKKTQAMIICRDHGRLPSHMPEL